MSLASAEAAEGRRRAANTVGYYNIKLGPSTWRFGTGLGLIYIDNVRAESQNVVADVVIQPDFSVSMSMPVTQRNKITLAASAGYSAYLQNPGYSRLFVKPGTELSFDMYVGDFWINFHDRFSITEDTYQDPTVVGVADLSRMENTVGLTALWDLNKIILRLGYDHLNYMSLYSEAAAYPDGASENFYGTMQYEVSDGMFAGVEVGGGLISYDLPAGGVPAGGGFYQDATQVGAGLFYEAQLSDYTRARVSGGYSTLSPDFTDDTGSNSDFSGFYARLGLSHRLNRYVDYTLTAGRSVSFTFYGGTIDLYTVDLLVNWHLIRRIGFNTGLTYQHGSYLYGIPETFDHLGPNLSVSRRLSEKLTASFGYHFYWRSSNLPNRDYTVNILNVRLGYQF
jgi:hypothetical protein